jgi:DNA-binding GntR family transcriptional regulator
MEQPEIARNTLSHQVYGWLRQQILSGVLKQGERLNEISVSETLGVSATPVREALRLLNGDGLVELEGRRGARVIQPTDEDIRDCFQVRKALECLALREACAALSPDDIAELKRISALMENPAKLDANGFFAADTAFHEFFLKRAGNSWLEQFLSTLKDFLHVVRRPLLSDSNLETTRDEHLAITRAVLRGRIDQAEQMLGKHIDRVCADVIRRSELAAARAKAEAPQRPAAGMAAS